MKKFKFIMPILAIVFALGTAFATSNIDVQAQAWYKNSSGQCVLGNLDQEGCTIGKSLNCTIQGNQTAHPTQSDCEEGTNVLRYDP
ncbi:DUF6520 family protein [Flagellimonas sp.]|uniref:DUF6520 family protein n=1 Tax=Flagellimonas sp. TaxID=2058762 RepID=UPI003AB6C716